MGQEMPTGLPLEVQRIQVLGRELYSQWRSVHGGKKEVYEVVQADGQTYDVGLANTYYPDFPASIKQKYENIATSLIDMLQGSDVLDPEIAEKVYDQVLRNADVWTHSYPNYADLPEREQEGIREVLRRVKVIAAIGNRDDQFERMVKELIKEKVYPENNDIFVLRVWNAWKLADEYGYDEEDLPYQDLKKDLVSLDAKGKQNKLLEDQYGEQFRSNG